MKIVTAHPILTDSQGAFCKKGVPILFRNTDIDVIDLHRQQLIAEAEQYRMVEESRVFGSANQARRHIRWVESFTARVARWRCLLEYRLPQFLFPGFATLRLVPIPCTCSPEPCTD
jgi:hypothetical protein